MNMQKSREKTCLEDDASAMILIDFDLLRNIYILNLQLAEECRYYNNWIDLQILATFYKMFYRFFFFSFSTLSRVFFV